MEFIVQNRKRSGLGMRCVRLLLAVAVLTVTLVQGLTFCLCAITPEVCGESCSGCEASGRPSDCHVPCGDEGAGARLAHECDHLTLAWLPATERQEAGRGGDILFVVARCFTLFCERGPHMCVARPVLCKARPPGTLYPQLIFIAQTTQILC